MDVLRNLFGNLTNGIIRLAVAVGIIAAVYFFAIRPVLDTTEDISNRAFEQQTKSQNSIQRQIQRSIAQTNRQVQRQVTFSFRQVRHSGHTPTQLLRCVQRANGHVDRIQRCAKKY